MRAEQTRIKDIFQPEDKKGEFGFKKERQEQFLMDSLEGVEEEDFCEHTPDKLDLLDTDYQGDKIIQHFRCRCGKSVKEIYTLRETKVS